jgi:2-polyprenyl-3-methyl-5-hydroxy-6-metoxy-1,4-benzoquinol methylase
VDGRKVGQRKLKNMQQKNRSIDEVKHFWDQNPLFSGEFHEEPGTRAFFEEHEKIIIENILAGKINENFTKYLEPGQSILDIGCGPGFWVRQFCRMGLEVSACDLSTTAINLTKKSLEIFDLIADVQEGNAEDLPYDNEAFDLINCQGVIHHTPDTEKCIHEFFRVLKPGGLACFSVYHRNFILRTPFLLILTTKLLSKYIELEGRGRDDLLKSNNPDEIVRLYDGKENPIGKSFLKDEIRDMINRANFEFIKTYYAYFPARALPIKIPSKLHHMLNNHLGLLIVFLVKKPI